MFSVSSCAELLLPNTIGVIVGWPRDYLLYLPSDDLTMVDYPD